MYGLLFVLFAVAADVSAAGAPVAMTEVEAGVALVPSGAVGFIILLLFVFVPVPVAADGCDWF